MLKEALAEAKEKFAAVEKDYKREISKFRTGRASVSILDGITIDYYGTATPINQLATLAVPEANLIVIQPWDPKIIADIERSIQKSNVDLNPISDGKVLKIPIPPLDEERRLDIIKTLKKYTEERKTVIRNIRREFRDLGKTMKDEKEISEDEEKRFYDDLQKLVDNYINLLEKIEKDKEAHILED